VPSTHDFESIAIRMGVIPNAAVARPFVVCQKLLRSQGGKQHAACGQQSGVQEITPANRLIQPERSIVLVLPILQRALDSLSPIGVAAFFQANRQRTIRIRLLPASPAYWASHAFDL